MAEGALAGAVALVTGAARGIGRACAVELARVGANVAVVDVQHAAEAARVVQEIEGLGRQARFWRADAGDRDAMAGVVAETAAAFGRLDVAVANAGVSVREPFLEVTPEGLDTTLRPTMYGVLWTCQAAARQMVKQAPLPGRESRGKLVVIASVHAEHPFPLSGSYNMAKAGVVHLMRTAAVELAEHKINVNLIAPGWIDTPGERQHATEEELAAAAQRLPWGRLGRPEEIARMAVYLASPSADFMTGSLVRVDAGEMVSLRS
ncbi:MAG: SDR family NAD(P)-dependent oxidoreductase [Chloroflexota bacterium]